MGYSYARQHFRRPQTPVILVEFRESFCSLAIFMVTGWKLGSQLLQHNVRPHDPSPAPVMAASSRTPICFISILARRRWDRSRTRSRKSTRSSAVKKTVSLFPSLLERTCTIFMGHCRPAARRTPSWRASPSRAVIRRNCSRSSGVARRITGFRGCLSLWRGK